MKKMTKFNDQYINREKRIRVTLPLYPPYSSLDRESEFVRGWVVKNFMNLC